jgi:hypothetical protein
VAHFVKNPSYPNPMLTVKEGPEGLRVGMHDGRHRALAAQQQGQNLINVEISRGQKFKRENPNVTDADLAQRIQRENLLPEWDN